LRHFLILFLLLIITLTTTSAYATGKLVIVTIGGVSLDQLTSPNLPNISRLIDSGAVGIMNVRPAAVRGATTDELIAGYSMGSCCATISAGTRAAVTADAGKAFNADETILGRPGKEFYASLFDRSVGEAEVIHLGINQIRHANENIDYPIEIGALGKYLHRNGIKTATVGNSDMPNQPHREAVLIAADPNGIVDFGNVGSDILARDPNYPYGIRSNISKLTMQAMSAIKKAGLIVVDIGDTSRAAEYATKCTEKQQYTIIEQSIRNADQIIGSIISALDLRKDRILLISTHPSQRSIDRCDFLPPVVAAGAGIKHGLLISGSTRSKGIITNCDISAGITDYFNIKQPLSFVGRPIAITDGSIDDLIAISSSISTQTKRQPIMRGIAFFIIFFSIVVSLYVLWRRDAGLAVMSWIALIPSALLLAVILAPIIASPPPIQQYVILISVLTIALIAICWLITKSPGASFALICFWTTVIMLLDLARGGVLARETVLSYSPVDGARYYGIGNELMGSLIGSAMITIGFIASALAGAKRLRIWVAALLLTIVVLAIGLPSKGANAGGAMSAAVASIIGFALWRGRRITKAYAVAAVLAVPIAFGLIALADQLRSGGFQSHIGRAIGLTASGGIGELFIIMARKLEMNIILTQNSLWSRLLFILAASSYVLLRINRLEVINRLRKSPDVTIGIIAAGVGAIAAVLLNDSGVVAGAIALIYVWTALLLTALAVPRETLDA
jgi:hypothetical protein